MKIIEDIKNMVEISYDIVIEGEGIYDDFKNAEIDLYSHQIDKFIADIPEETLEKWKKKLRKKTLRDFLTNSPNDYKIDEFGNLSWANSDVEDWQMQFFCDKIVKQYQKETATQKRYRYTVSTATIWTSFDYGEVVATNVETAREIAQKELKEKFDKANAALAMNEHTKDMCIEYCKNQIQLEELS